MNDHERDATTSGAPPAGTGPDAGGEPDAPKIAILMLVFALGGTSYGMWEETLGFFALLVPLPLFIGVTAAID